MNSNTRYYNARSLLRLAAMATCALLAGRAQATDRPPVLVWKAVDFRVLDLNTREGALRVYERLQHAARFVCSDLAGVPPPAQPQTCYEDSLLRRSGRLADRN